MERRLAPSNVQKIWFEIYHPQPVGNLSLISKLISKLQTHMAVNALYPPLQSAYRKQHSTEASLIKVHNYILRNRQQEYAA